MTRIQSENRAAQLMECATDVFMDKGYRRAQISDIARAMGAAPGTIYLYVESKEALFDLALQRALDREAFVFPSVRPVPTPSPGVLLARVTQQIVAPDATPTLTEALHSAAVTDTRAELSAILSELYVWLRERRQAINLVERSALDWPELADLFYSRSRRGLIYRLTGYLTLRIDQKRFRPTPDVFVAARLILETVAWFAIHRDTDSDSTMILEERAHQTVVAVLTNAFIPD